MCDKCKQMSPTLKKAIVTAIATEVIKNTQIAGLPIHPATVAGLRLAARLLEMGKFKSNDPSKLSEAQNKEMNEAMNQELDFILSQDNFEDPIDITKGDVNKDSEVETLNKLMSLPDVTQH